MIKIHRILIILFVLTGFLIPSFASINQDPSQQREELKRLREQIEKYENEIQEKKAKEANTLDLIAGLDREINITNSYIRNLRSDIKNSENQISIRRKDIESISSEIAKLEELVKKRMVNFYKHNRRQNFELLLSSQSLNQVKTWLKYQKLIVENDRRTFSSLIENKKQLLREQRYLQAEVYEKEQNISERQKEEEWLKNSHTKRTRLLNTIRNDTRYLERHLNELRESQKQIRNIISRSEEERLTKNARKTSPDDSPYPARTRSYKFSDLKGKLPWPTKGNIISHFGRQRHPVLRTITENLGIEIKAPLGAPVIAVDEGQIQTITWQRGLGNIIIISHDDGYYTVYTHLDEINIQPMQNVSKGEIIGTVGDTGSMNGPILHFQIWKNTKSLNPEDWIS
ncbi:peptidoglycan DD-metalloendopeptidase family protein [candidate division KSB1 bacterium]|nr:peptidoglycan DD-metalloendopeptidase family protein [candidate division KSB1 bacterium]